MNFYQENSSLFQGYKFNDLIMFEESDSIKEKRGQFILFKWALDNIDYVLVSETENSINNSNVNVSNSFYIDTLIRFPIIFFPKKEIKKYRFFPAKKSSDGIIYYNSVIYKDFRIGKTIEAKYRISTNTINPKIESNKEKENFIKKILNKNNSSKEIQTKYDIHHVEIITSTNKAYEDLYYTVSSQKSIKYPICTISDIDEERKYRYKFYVCTEVGETIELCSNKSIIRLIKSDTSDNKSEILKSDDSFVINKRNNGSSKYKIHCIDPDCMCSFELEERKVKLKPPSDVVEWAKFYNYIITKANNEPKSNYRTKTTDKLRKNSEDDEIDEIEVKVNNNINQSDKSENSDKEMEDWICEILFLKNEEANMEKTRKFLFYYGDFIKNDYNKEETNKNSINDLCSSLEPFDEILNVNLVNISDALYFENHFINEVDSYKIRDKKRQPISQLCCPYCNKPLLPRQGQQKTNIILLIGDTESGKTVYLANTLKAYLRDGEILTDVGVTVSVGEQAEEYLERMKVDIDNHLIESTRGISYPLYFEIHMDGISQYVVIYDIRGEWFTSEQQIAQEKRIGILKNIFNASDVLLFMYPVESIEVSGREKIRHPFNKILETIQNDIFNIDFKNTAEGKNKKIAFILSKVDKFRKDYNNGIIRARFHKFESEITKLMEIAGIETDLDVYISENVAQKREFMLNILNNEISITRDIFKSCFKTETSWLTRHFNLEDISFFSYGSPEDSSTGNKRYAAIRPFNSIQWIINTIFKDW